LCWTEKGLSGLVVRLSMFFALLGGVTAFGALGVVLGPGAFATAAATVVRLRTPSNGPLACPPTR
jgi:predicted PurR-regulated permease PerM